MSSKIFSRKLRRIRRGNGRLRYMKGKKHNGSTKWKFSYKRRKEVSRQAIQSVHVHCAAAFMPAYGFHEERSYNMKVLNREDAGEDAFVIVRPNEVNTIVGVADGVGGYAKYGIDSSLTSWGLMENIRYFAADSKCPREMLSKAYRKMVDGNEVAIGGTTACIASFETTTTGFDLHVANLGDSGLLVIRDEKIMYRTKDQLLGFNFPQQLSLPFREPCSKPEDASVMVQPLSLQKGDIVILGTDGLFDNIFDTEIATISRQIALEKNFSAQYVAQKIANELVNSAYKVSVNQEVFTPFEEHAMEWNQLYFGGKPDDVTVVVCCIQ